jgi:protein-S-isoprenylcysteine O-methyltransferase Ste14
MIYAYEIIIILFCSSIFGFLHSWLASNKVKSFIRKQGTVFIAFYRYIYNIFSIFLIAMFMYIVPRPDLIIYDLKYPYDLFMLIPQFISLVLVIAAFLSNDLGELSGISQIIRWFKKEYTEEDNDERTSLTTAGFYKYSRHPLYLSIMLFLVFRPVLDLFSLTLDVCFAAYFYIGSIYEERKLEEKFGQEYTEYKKRVRRFI